MKRPTKGKEIKINLRVDPPKFTISEKKDDAHPLLKNIPLSPGIKKILGFGEINPQFHGFFKPELMKPVEWCEDLEEYERREQQAIADTVIGWSVYKYEIQPATNKIKTYIKTKKAVMRESDIRRLTGIPPSTQEWIIYDKEKAKVLKRSCWNCGTVFETSDKRKKYCCQKCAWKDHERWRKIKRSERLTRKQSLPDNKYAGITHSIMRECPICQEKYYPKTIRSITCGKGNCRTAWSRQQKNNKN